MQELKNVKNTVEKEQEKDSNSQKDNLFYISKTGVQFPPFFLFVFNKATLL